MNVEVNTNKIASLLKDYDNYVNSYEDVLENLFYEIEKLNSFWIGADKDEFTLLMDKEELSYELLINKMKALSVYYSLAANKYNKFYTSMSSEID